MNTKDIVYIALFAAVMAALGAFPPLPLSFGVPITAQSMGVMLAGGILGAKRGALSMVLFLILIAVGLPLLSGGRGGLGMFGGPSGGFLVGWVVSAYVVGMLTEKYWSKLNLLTASVITILGGVVLLYAIGIPWVAVAAKISFSDAFWGSLAFVPGDLVKAVVAAAIIIVVKQSYPLISK